MLIPVRWCHHERGSVPRLWPDQDRFHRGWRSLQTAETICYEIFREILREVRQFDANKLLVVASQKVVDMLLDDESASVAELELFIGRSIAFQVEPLYTQEQYDIVLL